METTTRYVWVFWARWWECVSDGIDLCGMTGTIPGLIQEKWSYVDLWETEETIISPTQEAAEAEFENRFPWIEVYHTSLLGEYRPPKKKAKSARRARKLNPGKS